MKPMASRAKRARSRGRAPKKSPQFGRLEPRYTFTLNPYRDARFTRCPICDQPTKLRKFVFVIHVDPMTILALGLTCRFCPTDALIICHQDELEAQLAIAFQRQQLPGIGNPYLVLGTLDREPWRLGLKDPESAPKVADLPDVMHDFVKVIKVEPARWGWYPDDSKKD
jgi:hypothetical protein